MAIGGTNIPSDNNTYSMIILQNELLKLYCKNIIFDSYNGSIYISGFDQSQHMYGIYGGEIKFIASTANGTQQKITFDDDITSFYSNNNGIIIYAYNGINIAKNISSTTSSIEFIFNDSNWQ